jgi:hypothetical protein
MDGQITEYNPFNKRGKISSNAGEFAFDAPPGLAGALSDTTIPTDPPVGVKFDPAGDQAINVVLWH